MSALSSHHSKYRTKLCRNFAGGHCPFGDKCSFIHPTSINLPPPLLAQYPVNWNAFLPQILALSNQQGAQKVMPPRSLPRSQGPRLVDEDHSPSTSLLLSTSDSTSPGRTLETGASSRRRKYPCRHFVRTGGWCPVGARCKFQHDIAAAPSASIQKVAQAPPLEARAQIMDGGTLMSRQPPSLSTINDSHLDPPRHIPAELAQHYQPMYWLNYTWQPYYATASAATVAPAPVPTPVVQHGPHPSPNRQTHGVPPSETQASLPTGSYAVNGTTYFPTSTPSAPAHAPVTYPFIFHSLPYNHPMFPAYPYHALPTLPANYHAVSNQIMDIHAQSLFDPFASDMMITSDSPVVPRPENYQMSPIQHLALPLSLSPPPPLTDGPVSTIAGDRLVITKDPEHEFPYRPRNGQRVGHVRRISVNIKKQNRADGG